MTLEVGWNVQPWVGALTWTRRRPFWLNGGRWKGLSGGRSEAFGFPALKGKRKETVASGEGGVPKAAEASPVV